MTGQTDGLQAVARAKEDPALAMRSDDDVWSERTTGQAEPTHDAHTTEGHAPAMTIAQRFEVERTLVALELESEQLGVPIGTDDRFLLREILGRGSMGAVYLADDVELERNVAIKVVSRRLEHGRLVLRLRREARALAALDHPNVVKIFDIGKEHGEPFIAMEHVAGQTLRRWQQGRGVEPVLAAYMQAGRGLAAAHERGIVHRDFKPDNALVDEQAGRVRVRVGDFGLAGDDPDETTPTAPDRRGSQSSSRGLLGTLVYMAPEQLRGERADARSDQHQFCVALWEAIAGARPFDPSRPLTGDTAVPSCPPTMPRWLHRVLRRGLAFEADARYPSMDALLVAIERGRLLQRSRSWLAVGGLAAVMAGTTWQATRTDPCETAGSPIEAIWTDEARADIEAAFGPQDAQRGETMTEYLVGRLDRATAQWSEHARQLCEAREHASAIESGALERRQTCIDRWTQRMQSRIEWLRHPDDARREQAFELVAPLSLATGSCALPPVLIDASMEAALEAVEQAELLRDLDGALVLANEAVELASTNGTPCAADGPDGEPRSSEQAAAYLRLGHVLGERGEARASLVALARAHEHANACHDDHRDAEARIYAAKVLAADLEDVDAASEALDDAWVALRHMEEPEVSLRRYDERMAAGIVAEYRHDYEGARRHAEEGRAALGDPAQEPILAAKLDVNIGVVFQKEGRFADAAAAYGRAIERVSEALGQAHPQARRYAARQAFYLGLIALEARDRDRMRERFAEAAMSDEPVIVAQALTAWAQGEYETGDEQAALARTMALLEFTEGEPELPDRSIATAETTAGQLLVALGKPGGIGVLERACAKWRTPHLSGSPDRTACELALVWALMEAGRLDEARESLERLLRLGPSFPEPLAGSIRELEDRLRLPAPVPPPSGSTTGARAPSHP